MLLSVLLFIIKAFIIGVIGYIGASLIIGLLYFYGECDGFNKTKKFFNDYWTVFIPIIIGLIVFLL